MSCFLEFRLVSEPGKDPLCDCVCGVGAETGGDRVAGRSQIMEGMGTSFSQHPSSHVHGADDKG